MSTRHLDSSAPDADAGFVVGFYLSFRIILTVFLVRVAGTEPQLGSAVRIALNFFFVAAVWLLMLGSPVRRLSSFIRIPTVRWVCAYLGLSLCSLLWGEAASAAVSFAYWCETASDVLLIALLLRGNASVIQGQALMRGFIWGTCAIALIAWIMPQQYDLRLGDEAYFNSNNIGNLTAFAVFFAQYLERRNPRSRRTLSTIFLAVTLLRTLSKTTIVAFAVAEAYLILSDRSMNRRNKLLIIFGVLLALFVFWGLLTAYFDFYTSYGNESMTLTGRTAIWAYVGEHGLERPWLGHGFDSMWKVVPAFGGFEARHAENEVLEQFYSYGLAGVIVLTGLYRSFYGLVRRYCQGADRVVLLAMLLYVLVRGGAEAEPFDLLLPLWMVTLIVALAVQSPAPVQQPVFATDVPVRAT